MKYPLFTREIESREYYGNMAEDAESKYVAITDTFGYVPDIKTAEDVVKHSRLNRQVNSPSFITGLTKVR